MPYKFSPSSLALLKDCPRCFWLHFNKNIRRPAGIFPSLPSGMDKILKIHFDNFRDKGKLPPEFVAELITNRIGESYFEVLQALEGDTPNLVHLWLATLAKAGFIKSIITTNFDTLIERAFQVVGAPLRVFVESIDYEKSEFPDNFTDIAQESPCNLFKLHGTATKPKTCIDTLAQRKQGLHPRNGSGNTTVSY